MKYSLDTELLYIMNEELSIVMRFRAAMKAVIDEDILRTAANKAIQRYPYFKVRIDVDEEGGYVLIPNDLPIVVTRTSDSNPVIGSKDVNYHIAAIDYEENIIYFNLSHNAANAPGMMEWVLTTLYEYVSLSEGRALNCPKIRMTDSEIFSDECIELTSDILPNEEPVWKGYKDNIKTFTMMDSLIPCMAPGCDAKNFYIIRIDEEALMKFIGKNDASPASLFSVLMYKAAVKRIPEEYEDIAIDMPVSTARILGVPNHHSDTTMHIQVRYKRNMASWDIKKLCTVTRGNIFLQTDPSVAASYWKGKFEMWKALENINGLKQKREYMVKSNVLDQMSKSTANISYIGRYDLGELGDYVDSVVCIIDGEACFEAMAMNNEFILSFFQKNKKELWFTAFISALDEAGILYHIEGPFKKNMSKLELRCE